MIIAPRWIKVFRDLWDNKSRTLLIIFSIAIGVFAFGGLFIARDISMESKLTQWQQSNPADISFMIPSFDDSLVQWAGHQPYVTAAHGSTVATAQMLIGDNVQTIFLYAHKDFNDIPVGTLFYKGGSWPPGLDQLYLERSRVLKLDLKYGDPVRIELPDGRHRDLIFSGVIHDLIVRPEGIQPESVGYVTPETMHRIGLPATYNRLELRIERATEANPAVPSPEIIAESLRSDLRRMNVYIASMTVNSDGKSWSDDILAGMATILVLVGLMSLLLSGFLVVNTISGLMAQQKRQIGVMKIIGAARGQIIGVYLVMVASFGAIALVLAIPSSLLMAYMLAEYIGPNVMNFDILDFHMPLYILGMEVTMAFLTPLMAALFPILGGTAVPAAQAISDYVASGKHNPIDIMLARLSGLSTPVLLALRNTFRRKVRLFITALTLVLAGAFFITILNVRAGLNTNLERFLQLAEYDVQLILDRPYDAHGLERMLSEQPGVAAVESWTGTSVDYNLPDGTKADTLSLIGLPQDSQFVDPPILDGRWLSPYSYDTRYELIVTDRLRDDQHLAIGDQISLERSGNTQTWTVVGVIEGALPFAYSHYESVARFDQTPTLADRVSIGLTAKDDASRKALTEELKSYLESQDIKVTQSTSRAETIANMTGSFNILITVLMGMAILIALVAGMGLTGTMSLNVLERTREIGVMRAVGAGNGSLQRIFAGEGIMIGLLSSLIAAPLSLPMTYAFGNLLGQIIFQQPLAYAPQWSAVVIWLSMVLLVSTVASLGPARRASQISIREAIAYE